MPPKAKTAPKTKSRTFNRQVEQIHDLYRLETAKVKKNISYKEDQYILEDVEHVHYFHSIDTAGNPQNTSVPINGHFHIMELVEEATDDSPPVYQCSKPMKWVRRRDKFTGRWLKEAVPCGEQYQDFHTHKVTYKHSEKFMPQPTNAAASQFIAHSALASPPPSVEGIQG